jgi:hypothetical protein
LQGELGAGKKKQEEEWLLVCIRWVFAINKTTYIDGEFGIGVVVGQWCPTPSFRGLLRMNDGAEKE